MFSQKSLIGFGMVCLMMVSSVHAQSDGCGSGIDYAAQAQHQFDADAYADAFNSYTCALEENPVNDIAHVGRLKSSLLTGDYLTAHSEVFLLNDSAPSVIGETIVSLTNQIADSPNANFYITRAFLYTFSGQPQAALEDADHLLKLKSDPTFVYMIQAAANELTGHVEESAQAFASAIELAPNDPQLYGMMAAVHYMTFNIPAMAEDSSRAIELAPNHAHAHRLHGMSQMFQGKPEAALAEANQAIELDPSYYAFYILRANAHRALGDTQVSFEDFNTAIHLNPRTRIGYGIRAQIQLQLGRAEAAAMDFDTSIKVATLETIDGEPLIANKSLKVVMTRGRSYRLPLEGHAGQVVNISATSVQAGEVDSVLLLISPNGVPLVFNDDVSDEDIDAAINTYVLPESGTYTLVVSHANGGSEGEIEILITRD